MSNKINGIKINLTDNSTLDSLLVINKVKSGLLLNIPRINKNYLFALIDSHIIHYPSPITLTYAWSFGSLAGICLVIQMLSGIFSAMHYTPHIDLAFSSVEYSLLVINKVKPRFINQKRLFNIGSVQKNVLKYLSEISEDEKNFKIYFKKRFPKSFKYLPIIKFVAFLFIPITSQIDYQTYLEFLYSILQGESLISTPPTYTKYSFYFYLVLLAYELVLSVYVTLNANHPVKHAAFQIGKNVAKITGISSAAAVLCSYTFSEPTAVTNFVHTKTPLGRGFDYLAGDFGFKVKGDFVCMALGRDEMIRAVQKYAPDSMIVDVNELNSIMTDPEFKFKIWANTTYHEKVALGIL